MEELRIVKGIGIKSIKLLNKLNINNIYDLVTHYPFRYNILEKTGLDSERVVLEGIVESIPTVNRFKGNMNVMNFRFNTNDTIVNVSIFNRAFLKSSLRIGKPIVVIGKYDKFKNTVTASEIRFGVLGDKTKIEPIYSTTSGLSNKILSRYISNALDIYLNNIYGYVPKYIREKYNLMDKKEAVKIIHNPSNIGELKQAQISLKYDELFIFMLKTNYLKMRNKKEKSGLNRDGDISKVEGFINQLPFLLTFDQRTAIDEILKDLKDSIRMNRLLQGDVGSGKTVVAAIAMYYNFLSGYQSALMVPTEVLANQHYQSIKDLFKNVDINIGLLTGSLSKKEKMQIYENLKSGKIDIIIGTHALIQDNVEYYNLGLVITDEQHRFGVNQRANLRNKGMMPDILYMSATPIPRTYALTIYGDMEISNIKTMPSDRKPIKTLLKSSKEMKEVLTLMWEELEKGHQIYVIAPLIEESEKLDLTNVNLLKEKIEVAFGKKYNIGILHGRMDAREKEKVMDEFSSNKINILISTTVIEVGVNVLNATMIVIFDADRFGLSTLHQLRGRVGRSNLESCAILISDKEKERLNIMKETNDGFLISEADFKIRGYGDLFGVKQSGDMAFKIADLKKDFKILLQAKEDSYNLLNNDSFNTSLEYEKLRQILSKLDNLD
jgi:ATP-dependent DNA helicase RecG